MRKIKEILRLHGDVGLSMRQIARSLSIAYGNVSNVVQRAKAANLVWPLPAELDEGELERQLYRGNQGRPRRRPDPDWTYVDTELRRHKGVTLELLWIEYKQTYPADGYQYSQFCEHYRQWRQKLDLVLRQPYRAGEKMLVDYPGMTLPIVNPVTGEIHEAPLFVAVLGASNFTYVEVQWAPDLSSWIGGHCRALAFFHGVPAVVVPDNLKAGVRTASWYEPELNPAYADWAAHYGTVVIPARPYRPRDKAKAEASCQLVERWILAVLRHRTLTSLDEANTVVTALRDQLNARPFRKRAGSRQSLFELLDRPALRPLPATPYEFAQWKQAKVSLDYHLQFEANFYSVPYQLIGERVDVRFTAHLVEVLYKGRRVASHPRVHGRRGSYQTDPAHRPEAHKRYLEWTPERVITWAQKIGPQTAKLVETIFQERPHPEQGYRSCLGILHLSKYYPPARLEAAAARALVCHAFSYRSVKSMLENGLDQTALAPGEDPAPPLVHENVRGAAYFVDERGGH